MNVGFLQLLVYYAHFAFYQISGTISMMKVWVYVSESVFGHFFFTKFERFLPWEGVHHIGYSGGLSLVNGILINGFEYNLNFFWMTNVKKVKKILYDKLPRENASIDAEAYFFQKWEENNP